MTNQLLIALAAIHSQRWQVGIGVGAELLNQYLRFFWQNNFIISLLSTHLAHKGRQQHFVFEFINSITGMMTTFIENLFF